MLFTIKIDYGTNTGGGTGTDLSTLPYADDDFDAGLKLIPIKGYYLASSTNTMGVKYGTLVRREFALPT